MGLYIEPLFDVIDVWAGKTWTRTYTVRNGNGDVVPLTGAEVRFMVRANQSDEDPVLLLFRDAGLVVNDLLGTIAIVGTPTNATDLFNALYRGWGHMGIEIKLPAGDAIPFVEGKLVVHFSAVR